jgi:hypothetical protein
MGRLRLQPLLARLGWRSARPAGALSPCARAILGGNASARFDEFRQYLDGWDFGRGHRLSAGSVAALELFLAAYPGFPTRPGLFLTPDGNLELAWENHAGQRVEIEFLPDRFQYLVENDGVDLEGEIELRRLSTLLTYLDQEAALGS